jgi:hypothetical protein
MFTVLYSASFLPWLISFVVTDRGAQWGLFMIDFALTLSAYVFLWWVIGWWSVPLGIGMAGLGKLMQAAGIRGTTRFCTNPAVTGQFVIYYPCNQEKGKP